MKKLFSLIVLIVAGFLTQSFTKKLATARIYPELNAFFSSLDIKNFDRSHLESLENIKYAVQTSSLDYDDLNVIFYCSENSFRSQAAQVFIHTLCYEKKYKKVKAFSAGVTASIINPKLIDFLSKIGYKVTKTTKDGKDVYEVRFSDKADPVFLFSKTTTDNSLPQKNITSVIVCDTAKENDCASLKTEAVSLNLPFGKIVSSDTEDKIEITLKNIATEMVYVTK